MLKGAKAFGISFFLRWQTWGEKPLLKTGQVDIRVTAKTQLLASSLVPIAQLLAQGAPLQFIIDAQLSGRDDKKPTGTCGNHAHRTAHNQGWRGSFAPGSLCRA